MEFIAGTLLGGAISLLTVYIQGQLAAKKDALTSSANLVAAAQAESRKRVIESVENLWRAISCSRRVYSGVHFLQAVWTAEEANEFFEGKPTKTGLLESVLKDYRGFDFANEKTREIEACLRETEVLHVSPRLWTLYTAIVAVWGRTGFLVNQSFEQKRNVDWREDKALLSLVEGKLEADLIERAKLAQLNGLNVILARLEAEFLKEGSSLIRGSQEYALSVNQIYDALQNQNRAEAASPKEASAE